MTHKEIKKRSVVIDGHKTSVSLEDEFWNALKSAAVERKVTIAVLLREIDKAPPHHNLSSKIRVYLFACAQRQLKVA